MKFLLWAIAVGALAGCGHAILAHQAGAAKSLVIVAAVFGVAGHVADWRATR